MADRSVREVLSGDELPLRRRRVSRGGISLAQIRNAALVMVGFLALLWLLQVVNWADSYRLDQSFGILPRNDGHLGDIVTAPFLHQSWQHLEGNSVPLLVLGFLAAYRGLLRFLTVTAVALLTSGLAVWLFQSSGVLTVGASGIIFGYFGYVVVRGLFDRNFLDAIVGVLAGLAYAYILTVAVPGTPGVSWLGHAGGLVGGVAAGWLLRSRRRAVRPAEAGRAGRSRGDMTLVRSARSAPVGATGTSGDAGGGHGGRARTDRGSGRPGGPAGFTLGRDNPRADLYKELDDLGL